MAESVYIWGKNPVYELIESKNRSVYEVFVQNTRVSEFAPFLKKNNLRYKILTKEKLHNLISRSDHQGIVVETEPFPYTNLSRIISLQEAVIVLAEGVTDPQNLGAMIRSAYLLGAKGFVIAEKYSASITPVVTHTSAGATERIAISMTNTIAHAIYELKERGFEILATKPPVSENVIDIRNLEVKPKTAILLGSEGTGIKQKTLSLCDRFVTIPQAGKLDSFSVSAATAIVLFQLASKKEII